MYNKDGKILKYSIFKQMENPGDNKRNNNIIVSEKRVAFHGLSNQEVNLWTQAFLWNL